MHQLYSVRLTATAFKSASVNYDTEMGIAVTWT
jgi:hypothetical protein